MIILASLNTYNILLVKIEAGVNLWRIEQAIDNKNSFIVPSYLTLNEIRNFLKENSIEGQRILGIDNRNTDILHSLAMWAMNGRTVKLADTILPFIYKINLLEHIEPSILFRFPGQCLYIDNKIGEYNGALICKDYADNGLVKDYMLNISLITENNSEGRQFTLMLPKKHDVNFIEQFKKIADVKDIEPFLYVLLFTLYEYMNKQDFFTQNDTDFIGYELADEIEQNKFKDGYWRSGHWHTYFVKNEGVDQFIMKLIKPVWVNG